MMMMMMMMMMIMIMMMYLISNCQLSDYHLIIWSSDDYAAYHLMILCWLSVKRKKERNKQTKKQIQVVDCRIIHFWLSNCHLIIWWSDDNKGGCLSDNSLLLFVQPSHAVWVDNAIYADTAIYAINTMPFMQTMPLMQTMTFMPSMQRQLCIQCHLYN